MNGVAVVDIYLKGEYVCWLICAALLMFVVAGMLTSHKSMDLQKMHTMLKLFGSGSDGSKKYSLTAQELERYLLTLVAADKIEVYDGQYSLKK